MEQESRQAFLKPPSNLLDYIEAETGLPRSVIVRVLEAERRYYLSLLID